MSMPNVGDTLVVSKSHKYFYNMDTTFTYLGKPALHAIRSDTTGEIFNGLLTDTVERFFTIINPITENE